MNKALEPDLKSKTFFISKSYHRPIEKEVRLVSFKFYQNLFVILISFSIILIIPESPRELENICESHNSIKVCNVW